MMKTVFGWVAMVFLSPFIAVGILAYAICDAVVFGWKLAEDSTDDL